MRPLYKILLIVVLLVLTMGILYFFVSKESSSSINENKQTEGEFDYYQFKAFDLRNYEINTSILLPDETAGIGTAFAPEMVHDEGSHLWQLQSGRNFILYIEDLGELENIFRDFKSNLLKSNAYSISTVDENDSLFVYGRKLSKEFQDRNVESFHIFAIKKIDGRFYQFKNREEGNTKTEVLFMQKSIESIK